MGEEQGWFEWFHRRAKEYINVLFDIQQARCHQDTEDGQLFRAVWSTLFFRNECKNEFVVTPKDPIR